jgi:hypothetical protein
MLGSMPNMNSILFYSSTTPGVSIAGPALSCKVLSLFILFGDHLLSFLQFFRLLPPITSTKPLKIFLLTFEFLEDDEFSSNSMMGILSYTTPSVMTLLGRTWD